MAKKTSAVLLMLTLVFHPVRHYSQSAIPHVSRSTNCMVMNVHTVGRFLYSAQLGKVHVIHPVPCSLQAQHIQQLYLPLYLEGATFSQHKP